MSFEYPQDAETTQPDDTSLASSLNRYLLSEDYVYGGDYKLTSSDAFLDWSEQQEADKSRKVSARVMRRNADGAPEEVYEEVPMFFGDSLSRQGSETFNKAKQYLDAAASMPDGGVYRDPETREWKVHPALEQILSPESIKQNDPLRKFKEVKEEVTSLAIEGQTPEFTYDAYVDRMNAGKPADSPTLLDKDNESMRKAFDQRNALDNFDPSSVKDQYLSEVGGVPVFTPGKLHDLTGMHRAIDASPGTASDHKMMKLRLRDTINGLDASIINEASDAAELSFDATRGGVLAPVIKGMEHAGERLFGADESDLKSRFAKHMEQPGNDMYSFIEQNQEELSKEQYGMADKLTNAFWSAARATGAGAMWLAAKPVGGADWVNDFGSASSTADEQAFSGMGGIENYRMLGMDFTNKGVYDLVGQIGTFMATAGAGALLKGGVKMAAAKVGGVVGAESAGAKLVANAGARVTASEEAMKAMAQKLAPNTAKNLAIKMVRDPSAYIGGLQAAGMSFGQTYNQVLEQTGDVDQAYSQANMQATANGLSAFIATAIFNRVAPGIEKGMSGVEGGFSGGIIKHLQFNKAVRQLASKEAKQEAVEVFSELASPDSALSKALVPALREVVNRSARAAGLRGYGAASGMVAEFMEESSDEALADLFFAMQDDATTWSDSVWDNIQEKFSQYMAAGVMGALGGGFAEGGHAFVEEAGQLRKKNREQRKEEIQQYATVMWNDIKNAGLGISDNTRDMAVKAGLNGELVPIANYMVDESVPVATRAKVIAEHAAAVSGQFRTNLASTATTAEQRAATAQERAKNAPPTKEQAASRHMAGTLGQALEGTEWNPEAFESLGPKHEFRKGGEDFVMEPVILKKGGTAGAVVTNAKGESRTVSAKEAASLLKESAKPSMLSRQRSTRDQLVKGFDLFSEEDTSNYAKPTSQSTAKPEPAAAAATPEPAKKDSAAATPKGGKVDPAPSAQAAAPISNSTATFTSASGKSAEVKVLSEPDEMGMVDVMIPDEFYAGQKEHKRLIRKDMLSGFSQTKESPAASDAAPTSNKQTDEKESETDDEAEKRRQERLLTEQAAGAQAPVASGQAVGFNGPARMVARIPEVKALLAEGVHVVVEGSEVPSGRALVVTKAQAENEADMRTAVAEFQKALDNTSQKKEAPEKEPLNEEDAQTESSSDSGDTLAFEYSTPAEEIAKVVEDILSKEEKQVAAEELGEAEWNEEAKKRFSERMADWLVTGKDASVKLIKMFLDVMANAKSFVVAGMVAVSLQTAVAPNASAISLNRISSDMLDLQSEGGLLSKVEEDIKQAPEKITELKLANEIPKATIVKEADFGSESVPTNVRVMANWIMQFGDNNGLPFSVVDKTNGSIYFFDKEGTKILSSPALVGAMRADILTQAQKDQTIEERRKNKKDHITPAGRFETKTTDSQSSTYDNYLPGPAGPTMLQFAVHKVYLGRVATEHRMERLQSGDPLAKRISLGCINVPIDVMDQMNEMSSGGVVIYIMPETSEGKSVFAGFEGLEIASDTNKKPSNSNTLNALPNSESTPDPTDPLFADPTTPAFFVNLDQLGKEDEFGGIWKAVDGGYLYTPAKGKSLPIGLNTVVEVAGRPEQILIHTEQDAGGYAFRSVDVAKFSELANRKNIKGLTRKGEEWDRNRLEQAGLAIEPILKELLKHNGKVSDAVFDKMLADVLAVVAPGSNIKQINFDKKLENGEFFQTERLTTTEAVSEEAALKADPDLVRDSNGDPVIRMVKTESVKPKVETSGKPLTAKEQAQLTENETWQATQPPLADNGSKTQDNGESTEPHYVMKDGSTVRVDQYVAPPVERTVTEKENVTVRFNLDRANFISNLRSVFTGYNPNHGEVYDRYVANEVARQIAAFVDEEQTHFVALREFTDAEMVSFFDSAVKLADDKNAKGEVRQGLINDVFQRVAAQRVKGKAIADFNDSEKFLVASETMRALNQLLVSGQSTEGQSTASKRLLIALNEDFSQAKGPFKTIIELLKRYMDKLRRMAHIKFMMGRLDSNMQNLLRRQSTAYDNAKIKGDVDMMREKGLDEAVRKFMESRKVSAKQIGQIAMAHTEALNDIRAIAKAASLSLDDMIVLDYEKGTLMLSDASNERGLNLRSYIEKYFPSMDLEALDNALAELNEAGALGMVQQDLMLAWDRLVRARELAPDFLKLIDGSVEDGNNADEQLKVHAMLVRSAPSLDNGRAQIREWENKIEQLLAADRLELRGINSNIVHEINQLDLSKVSDGLKAMKAAKALGFNVPIQPTGTPRSQPTTTESYPNGLNPEEWKVAFGQHAFDMASLPTDDGASSWSSDRLLPAHQILLPNAKPFVSTEAKRKQLSSDMQAFKDAILSEKDFKALSLRMEEDAKILEATAASGRESFGAIAPVQHDLLKARRLRAAAKVNVPFVEEEMANYVNYLEALNDYNRANRRVVNEVLGEEYLSSKGFGLGFQSRVYQPANANTRNTSDLQSHVNLVKAKSDTGNLFPQPQIEDLTPAYNVAEAYGYNYETAERIRLLQKSSTELSFQVLTMHPSESLNPVFPDGPTGGVARSEEAFRLVPLPTSKDWQVQREMSSNMAYVGMMNQMQWQRLIDSRAITLETAENYEGTLGFNAAKDVDEDINATNYEGPEAFLPSYTLSSKLYAYEDGLRNQTGMTIEKLDELMGVLRMLEMPDGSMTARAALPEVLTESNGGPRYADGTYARHIQELKEWVEKILDSTDPTKIVTDINGMQTLAGRLAPRMRARALEALKHIEAQEQQVFAFHKRSLPLDTKTRQRELRGLLSSDNETHALFDISIRALRLDSRLARAAIRSFGRHRQNVVHEKVRTSRDAAWEEASLFFEDVRKSRIDGPTMTNMRWNIDHFSRSKTTRIDAAWGMAMYEDLRRISFAKDGEMLVVGGPNWVWSDVPVFERDAQGEVVREDVVGEDGKPVYANYVGPDNVLQRRPLQRYKAMRHEVDNEELGVKKGDYVLTKKQVHIDMDESERIAYAIQDRDNAGHFPLTSEMGEQANTVEKARENTASTGSVRSRVQRNQVNLDVERQLQNKWLTKTAMEIGLNLDDQLPTGRAYSDAAVEFLYDLTGLETAPQNRDTVVRKAMEGLFGTDDQAKIDAIVEDFETYLTSPGVQEVDILEPYVAQDGEVLQNESVYQAKAESVRARGRKLMNGLLSSIRVLEPNVNGDIQPYTREELATARAMFDALPEVLAMKQELTDAMVKAGTAFSFQKDGAGTKYRKVKRMVDVPNVSTTAPVSHDIDPFELLSAMVEFKAKKEMDLIDAARVATANGLPESGDGLLVGAIRTVVGNALSMTERNKDGELVPVNNDIKPTFASWQNKMQELKMGDLFSPAKASGFADAEQMRKIALMLHGEQLGEKPVNLYQGNAFANFNETGMVSANHAVNLLAQNIPGILIYQPSKEAINQNQAFFGSVFLPSVDGSPPMLYVSEANGQDNNRQLVTQALSWWATQSEQAELVAASLQGASERVRVALSPVTHVERLLKAVEGRAETVDGFLGDYAESLVEANPGKVSAMKEASRDMEVADLKELLRDHFTTMENLHALARPGALPSFGVFRDAIEFGKDELFGSLTQGNVFDQGNSAIQKESFDPKGPDLSALSGRQSLQSDILLLSEVMTNPKMKKLLDRFMFGDNLLNNPSNLENATLYKTFAAIKQMGEEAQEEQAFEGDNALEAQTDPLQANEIVEEEVDETDRERFEAVLDQVLDAMKERSGEEENLSPKLSEEEQEELRNLPPTVKSVQQWFRNRNHDTAVYGVMDERMEQVFAEFQEGAFNGDPNWSGAGIPASEAMLFNLFTDILSVAKPLQSGVPAQTQIEGITPSYPETGPQVLSQLSGYGSNPVVRANMPKPASFDAEKVLPGHEKAPTITTWNNMTRGRLNGRMATTLNFESNRYKQFAGGLLTRVDEINAAIERVAEASIDNAHTRWEDMGSNEDGFIAYQKAHADIHLSPELFAKLKESFPQLAIKEAEVRRALKKMEERRKFVKQRIGEIEAEVAAVREQIASVPEMFDSETVSVFTDDQRQLIEDYVLREAERYSREGGRPDGKRPRYKRLINQMILRMDNQNPSLSRVSLGVNLATRFDALERNPQHNGNNDFRKLLNEMNLPQDIKVALAQTNKSLTQDQEKVLRRGEEALRRAQQELDGMDATSFNPRKGGYFQRVGYEASSPWQMGQHTYVSPEKNPLGRSANVKTAITMYPEDNFGNPQQTINEVDEGRARWADAETKDFEFYIMKEALHQTLAEYARHADELHQSVKRQDTYFKNYNPAAVIRQVTDTMELQEVVAKARLDKFASDESKAMPGSQLSPEAIALLADPDTTTIYSASHVVEIMELRKEIAEREDELHRRKLLIEKIKSLTKDNEAKTGARGGRASEIIKQTTKLQAQLADKTRFKYQPNSAAIIKGKKEALVRLMAKRRVSTYKVPANFEARKDIIGHLVNNGEWIMLGQLGAEQDLKSRFYSQTERQPLTPDQLKRKKEVSIKDIVLNSLPEADMGATPDIAQNRMGFNEAYRSEPWKHGEFAVPGFSVPAGSTREQAAKIFAKRHAAQLIDRINNRPMERPTRPGQSAQAGNEVKEDGLHTRRALHQLEHMVEHIVLAYDKLEPSTEYGLDGLLKQGVKEDVALFLQKLADGEIGLSEIGAQNIKLVHLFAKVTARIEGQDSLKRLLLGLSTNLGPAELTAMKYLHHHDARVRIRFRKDYFAQLEAMRLHGYLQNGFDMESGRSGWKDQLKREKEELAEAMKGLGLDSMQQSIPLLVASLQGLLETRTHSVAANFAMWTEDLKTGMVDLNKYKNRQNAKAKGQRLGRVRKFFEAEHVDIIRDQAMARELYTAIKPLVHDSWKQGTPHGMTSDQFATQLINDAKEVLLKMANDRTAAERYAKVLNQKFKDVTDASEIMITALGQSEQTVEEGTEWNKFMHGALKGEAKFVSTVPLRYAYAADPSVDRLQLEEKAFQSDPLDHVKMQELSLLGGPGKQNRRVTGKEQSVFRPVNLNGISTVNSLLDDALYRLNVTPTYMALRHIVGNVQQSGPREAEISNSLILGDRESNSDMRLQRVALAGIAAEIDNEVANDMQNGVTNTAFSEAIAFGSSMYIAKALISFQQWWNQTGPSAVGYAAKKLATGKWDDAFSALKIAGSIVSSKMSGEEKGKFNHDAKEFIRRVAPFSADRGADGMDPLRENMRRQVRHGAGAVRKYSGVAVREVENWQEKGLDLTIARPERVLSRSIFLTELMAELRWMQQNKMVEQIPQTVEQLIDPNANWHIPQEAVQAAQTKVNDHMGLSDQGKKSFFFQNKTASPTWNALMRTIVRFSNHQSTTSSNASALAPALWQANTNNAGDVTAGTKRAREEALENIVGTLVQNSLFHAMKLRTLVPLLLYAGYLIGGDDEDEAMAKAQEKTDSFFNLDDEDNAFFSALKAVTLGKPGQFFQDWKDPDAAAVSAFAGLGSNMLSEILPVAPVVGSALGFFPISNAFKSAVTNNVIQDTAAALTGLDSAENKWDPDAVYIYEREQSGLQNAMGLTAPTSVAYDVLSGFKLAYDAADTGEVSAFDIAMYLFNETVFSTRELRQVTKKTLQEPVWENQ
jgi:hypothetical protein